MTPAIYSYNQKQNLLIYTLNVTVRFDKLIFIYKLAFKIEEKLNYNNDLRLQKIL